MAAEFASDTNSDASDFASDALVCFASRAIVAVMKPLTHLRTARKEARLTLEKVSAMLATAGIDLSPGQLSRLERGTSEVSRPRLAQLGKIYRWSPAELLAGRGQDGRGDDRGPRVNTVPLIDSVRAGNWHEVADPYQLGDGVERIPVRRRVGPRAFALELDGPSMEPEFHHRDVIVVDPDVEPQPGHYVVARIDDDNVATFKRYRVKGRDGRGRPIVELVPLNPDWPVLSLGTAKAGGRIVGVAVEHHRILV